MPITKEDAKVFIEAMKEAEGETKSTDETKPEVKRKFGGATPQVEVTSDPNDALMADKLGGFKSAGHFFREVVQAGSMAPRSEALKRWSEAVNKTAGYMEEGDAGQGGYLVPVQVSNNIMEKTLEASIVEPRASIQPMMSNRLEIPADVDKDHSTSYFGGIIIYRPGEAGTKTPTNPTFEKIALTLHKVTGLCYASDELLSDSAIALESYINRKFSQAIAFVKDDDFINGSGANMPLGAFNSANPSLVTVTAETGQGAATIVAENIIKMWSRLYPAGHGGAVWLANIECGPQLMGMSIAVGTGGIPVWMPAGGVSGRPYETLMGAPLIYTEKCQALGTAGDICLGNFRDYIIGQKGSGAPDMATSIHVRFATDETAFRFVLRYDGQPAWTSALTPKRGSATLSPFVVLNSTRT